jgi:hypothetical protein
MNTLVTSLGLDRPSHSSAFREILSSDTLRERVPAVLARGAHERTSSSYTFISTVRVLDALVAAWPVRSRSWSNAFARLPTGRVAGEPFMSGGLAAFGNDVPFTSEGSKPLALGLYTARPGTKRIGDCAGLLSGC